MKRLLLAGLGAVVLFSGCSASKPSQKPSEAAGELLLSDQQEAQLGDQLATEVKQRAHVLQDPAVQRYVNRIGQLIVSAMPQTERRSPFEFTVLDTPDTVNAFALPGGHVFVNSGLLRAVDSEAELASVLGHEVAHVALGHPSQQLASMVGARSVSDLANGMKPGLMTELATGIAARGYVATNSAEAESAADYHGLEYLTGAGYSARSMPRLFETLVKMGETKPEFVANFFATHPQPAERAASLEKEISERKFRPGRSSIIGGLDAIQAQVGGPAVGEAAPRAPAPGRAG